MARSIDEQEHAAKRKRILEAALRLIYVKGFERLTIQDLITALGISKGAFFHYFPSKSELLEAIIEQITAEVLNHLTPILEDPTLNARQKLENYFRTALHWKTERRELLLAITRAWYLDENAVVRQKAFDKGMVEQLVPILARLFEQGNRDGCWQVPQPETFAIMSVYLLQSFGDTLSRQLLSPSPQLNREGLEETIRAYTTGMERLLGAPAGSLTLLDPDEIALWFLPSPSERAEAPSSTQTLSAQPSLETQRENSL
ncbi:MAG: TetR/AcrR family transcriptional regulator [Anaerolineales bacterium]